MKEKICDTSTPTFPPQAKPSLYTQRHRVRLLQPVPTKPNSSPPSRLPCQRAVAQRMSSNAACPGPGTAARCRLCRALRVGERPGARSRWYSPQPGRPWHGAPRAGTGQTAQAGLEYGRADAKPPPSSGHGARWLPGSTSCTHDALLGPSQWGVFCISPRRGIFQKYVCSMTMKAVL
jgi:hypothetical protein